MRNLQKNHRVTPRDSRSLELYMRDISKLPLLSLDDEVQLAKRIHSGDQQALDQMVLGNLRFVITVAKNYVGFGMELPDLISVGNIGLITAAKRYDETRGTKFCSYAVWWIRQSIMDALIKEGKTITIPAHQVARLSKINNMVSLLEQELLRNPSIDEICDKLEAEKSNLEWLLNISERPVSLDAPVQSDDTPSLTDTLHDSSAPNTDDALMRESLHTDLERLLSILSPTESTILKMSFGIGLPRNYSLDEIAMRMDLSRERVRQLYNKALLRLQQSSACEQLKAYL